MKADEVHHAQIAHAAGGAELPPRSVGDAADLQGDDAHGLLGLNRALAYDWSERESTLEEQALAAARFR
jgi:hypothetical protein